MASDWDSFPQPSSGHVLFGVAPWSPDVERMPRRNKPCRVCGARRVSRDKVDGGAIPVGSRFYCAACTRYGSQHLLDRAALMGQPPDRTRQNTAPTAGEPVKGGKG